MAEEAIATVTLPDGIKAAMEQAEEKKESEQQQMEVQPLLQPAILAGSTNPLLKKLSPQKLRPDETSAGSPPRKTPAGS